MESFVNGDSTGHGKLRQGVLADLNQGFDTLTDAATVGWDCRNRKFPQGKLTSTQTFTLNMTNVLDGSTGTLKLVTNTSSAIVLTFDTDFTNKKLGGIGEESFTTYTFPAATAKEYLLSFICDGTTLHWAINETGLTSWTTTVGGFTGAPTIECKYIMIAPKLMRIFVHTSSVGTSSGTTANSKTMTLPPGVLAADDRHISVPRVNSNGSVAAPGVAVTSAGSNTITIYKDGTFSALWASSGQNLGWSFQGDIPIT